MRNGLFRTRDGIVRDICGASIEVDYHLYQPSWSQVHEHAAQLTLSVHRHIHLFDVAIRAKDFAHMRFRDIFRELLYDNLRASLWRCRAS